MGDQFAISDPSMSEAIPGIVWPDATTPHTLSFFIGKVGGAAHLLNPKAFVRVSSMSEGYQVEGVGVNLGYGGVPGLYGEQFLRKRDYPEGERHRYEVGARFYIEALTRARNFKPTSFQESTTAIVGVPGSTTARLFNSMRLLYGNVAVADLQNETGAFTSQTYDLAQSLLKLSINKETNVESGSAQDMERTISDSTGRLIGTVFMSERYGYTLIERPEAYPNTILLATAPRPVSDGGESLLEAYVIRGHGAFSSVMVLPGSQCNPRDISNILRSEKGLHRNNDGSLPPIIDKDTLTVLEQKLVYLLSEQTNQTVN